MQIIDNISNLLGDDLRSVLKPDSKLKIAASCFSIYAFEALKKELGKIESLSFIFTAPTFVPEGATDRFKKERREFFIPKAQRERSLYGSEFEIQLRNKLTQRAIARECADWIRKKATFRSNKTKAPMQQFVCVEKGSEQIAYTTDIFTAAQTGQDFSRATERLNNHVYDYCVTDSNVERNFVDELDTSDEVVVYAKLPRGFLIPTPVGDYNPDWAISFKQGSIKHIYFVAETKGTMSSMKLREIERTKIECARKFFDEVNQRIKSEKVKYDVVTDYAKLMDLVSGVAA